MTATTPEILSWLDSRIEEFRPFGGSLVGQSICLDERILREIRSIIECKSELTATRELLTSMQQTNDALVKKLQSVENIIRKHWAGGRLDELLYELTLDGLK